MNEAPVNPEHADLSSPGGGARTYRGSDVESLLPRIREELGPDALITCQRSGLTGGVAGFFQRPCVELEAMPATALALGPNGILAGDDEPDPLAAPAPDAPIAPTALDGPVAAEHAPPIAPAPATTADEAAVPAPSLPEPFADALADAARALAPQPPEQEPGLSRAAAAAADELVGRGVDAELASELVLATTAHAAPFAPSRRLKSLVRAALARRIPIAEPPAGGERRVAFVGPRGSGKTLCAERFAAAYAAARPGVTYLALRPGAADGTLGERVAAVGATFAAGANAADAKAQLASGGDGAVVVIDTPGTAVRDPKGIGALARELRAIGAGETHLVLPATIGLAAAEELVAAHAPLAPTALVISHADATTQHGPLVTLAVRHRLPISFLSHDPSDPAGLAPADAAALAGGLLP